MGKKTQNAPQQPTPQDIASLKAVANLKVLKRSDNEIIEIIGSASHCVMYEIEGTKWVKKDVEGTLFVVKRTQNPRFKMIVLNRNSPTNFEQVVDGTVAIKQMDKILMFKVDTLVRGLYFHDPTEMASIQSLFNLLINDQGNLTSKETVNMEATKSLMSALGINKPPSAPTPATAAPAPEHAQSPPPQTPSSPAAPNLVLDKKSLQLTLLSLIQDDRFVDLIHAQYIKVATARQGKK